MTRNITIKEKPNGRIRDKYSLEFVVAKNDHDATQTASITRADLKDHGYNGKDATPLNDAYGLLFNLTHNLNQSSYTDAHKQSLLEALTYDHHEVSALIRLIDKQVDLSSTDPISLTICNTTLTISASNWTRCVTKANERIAKKEPKRVYNTEQTLLQQIEANIPKPPMTPLLSIFHRANADNEAHISIVHDIDAYPDGDLIRKSEFYKRSTNSYDSDTLRKYGFTGSKAEIEANIPSELSQLKLTLTSKNETPKETGQIITYKKEVCGLMLMLDEHAKETAKNFKSTLDGVRLVLPGENEPVTVPQNNWEHYVSQAERSIAFQKKDNTICKHVSHRNIAIAAASGLTLGAIGLGIAVAVGALPVVAIAGVIAMVVLAVVAVTLGNKAQNRAQNASKKTIQPASMFKPSQDPLARSESRASVKSEASDNAKFEDAVDHTEEVTKDELNNWLSNGNS